MLGGLIALNLIKNEMTSEQQKLNEMIERRNNFSVNYCKGKGWTTVLEELTIEQIMEIRQQQGWKEIPTLIENGL